MLLAHVKIPCFPVLYAGLEQYIFGKIYIAMGPQHPTKEARLGSIWITIGLIVAASFFSCSKDQHANVEDPMSNKLNGKVIYSFTGDVYLLDLKTNKRSVFFTHDTYGFNNWDLSWDEQYRLTNEAAFDVARITLVRNTDGAIVQAFDYISPFGMDTSTEAFISPDNSKVVFNPTFDNGVVVADLAGEPIFHFESIDVSGETVAFSIEDEVLWLPDNSLLFTLDKRFILKSSPPYASLTLVKNMPYTQWGNLRVNRRGTQLSLMVSNHIHVMDIDGSNLHQVTESSGEEIHADFSPDGKYLLVAKKLGPTFFYWNLAVILMMAKSIIWITVTK